jgi:hypothetical protein
MPDELRALVFQAGTTDADVGPDERSPDAILSGWVGLVASERGLRYLGLPAPTYETALKRIRRDYPAAALRPDDAFLLKIARQVCAYLAGEMYEFSADLAQHWGTIPFRSLSPAIASSARMAPCTGLPEVWR